MFNKFFKKNVVNMVVLGPSRVGKTSLLATMYKEIGRLGAGFDFLAGPDTSDRLNEAFQKLNKVMNHERFTVVDDLMPGNKGFLEHRFDVNFKGTKDFEIVFHDYRGGLLMKKSDPEFQELKDRVSASRVIFNVLDAVALMEANQCDSDALNGHGRVFELLSETLNSGEDFLIVFVLVKSETYTKTATKREALIDRFQDRHQAVLNLVRRLNDRGKNVAAVLIPVSTLGCVEFKETIHEDGLDYPNFVFMRTSRDFAPKDVDQPLRYALSFALNHVNENRSWLTSRLRMIFGNGAAFNEALKQFCNARKMDYRRFGNNELLA